MEAFGSVPKYPLLPLQKYDGWDLRYVAPIRILERHSVRASTVTGAGFPGGNPDHDLVISVSPTSLRLASPRYNWYDCGAIARILAL